MSGPVVIHTPDQPTTPTITPTVRGYLAQAAAEARTAGVDTDTQEALDAIARLGITAFPNLKTSVPESRYPSWASRTA